LMKSWCWYLYIKA